MINTKLIQLLTTLSYEELKVFQKFVHSPFHNSNKSIQQLLDELAKYHPSFSSSRLKKETIFHKIYLHKKPYHEGRMNQLMTQLIRSFEEFVAYQEIRESQSKLSNLKLEAYRRRRLDQAFFKEVNRLQGQLDANASIHQFYLEYFQLNRKHYFHPATPRYQRGMKTLENCLHYLDLFFLSERLQFAAFSINRTRIFGEKYEIPLLDEIIETYKETIKQDPILNFYEKFIRFQQTGEQTLLKALIAQLERIMQAFNREEQQNILALLLNIGAQVYRQGNISVKEELFSLYKLGLAAQLFIDNEEISDVIFTNCVSIGSDNGDFMWTENFIQKYKHFLKKEKREDALNLSQAYLHFHFALHQKEPKNAFNKVIKTLNNISFANLYYSYQARSLLLRTYYEYYLSDSRNQEFVLDFCQSFERFIKRNNSLAQIKAEPFINFIRETKKIVKLKFDVNTTNTKLELQREEIVNNNNLFAKNWLLEKIEELLRAPH